MQKRHKEGDLSSFLPSLALLGLQLRPEAGIQISPLNYKDDLRDGRVDRALDKTRSSRLTWKQLDILTVK